MKRMLAILLLPALTATAVIPGEKGKFSAPDKPARSRRPRSGAPGPAAN